jgi:[acyl-carrier-protein] S-malonyltransferase
MGKIAFLFPGQGAQYAGMGKELYEAFDIVRDVFDRADEILGEPLSGLCFQGPEEELKKTENTQPGILAFSVAVSRLLTSKGIVPSAAAGLSLGEYGALVAAGSISFEDALPLVRKRGRFMQEAVPLGKGTMAAILGLDEEKLLKCCEEAREAGVVVIANYNCPGQLVISGEVEAVGKACGLAKAAGAKRTVPLQVSGPFHSPMLEPAGRRLQAELEKITINNPAVPVVSNVKAQPSRDAADIRELLVAQVSSSVRWADGIRWMLKNGINTFVEVGPGKVLTGFLKKIDKEARAFNVEDAASLDNTLRELEVI